MGAVAEDISKVKIFVDKCIESLEKGDYAYVCDGYDVSCDVYMTQSDIYKRTSNFKLKL